jgi:predicted component of type VI protein secretion system
MLCSECGRDNTAGLDFCDYCGSALAASGPGQKHKTQMEGGGGGGKRKTAMDGGGAPADPFQAALSGEVEDPFGPGGGKAKRPAPVRDVAPAADPAPKKRVTQFDSGDPFAPREAAGAVDERYAGRRIVGFLITYDRAPDGQCYFIREGRNLVGRDTDRCDIVIDGDDMVSSQHAILVYRNGLLRVADDKSQNGTFLNEDDVLQPEQVADADVIRVGGTRMICRLIDAAQIAAIWNSDGANA